MKCRHLFVFDIDWCNFNIDRDIDLVPLKAKLMLYSLLVASKYVNIDIEIEYRVAKIHKFVKIDYKFWLKSIEVQASLSGRSQW